MRLYSITLKIKYFVYLSILIICILFTMQGCFNPFNPKIDNTSSNSNIISDQKTIEGVYQNFKYAYTFKDSTIYGQLLPDNFVFTYFDYDLVVDVSWDRT